VFAPRLSGLRARWLDPARAQAFSFSQFLSLHGAVLLHAIIFIHTFGAIISFP
jgi:hypothetical protein